MYFLDQIISCQFFSCCPFFMTITKWSTNRLFNRCSIVSLQVCAKTYRGQPATCSISFTNPLKVPLKGGVFNVEGAGLLAATEVKVK